MTPDVKDISAVILSAGFSSRMNSFKPLLPINGKRMVEICIDLFAGQGIRDIIVVTGHHSRQLEPLVRARNAAPVFNPEYAGGMLSSVKQGIRHISRRSKGFFLLPVDIPGIRAITVKKLMDEFFKSTDKIIMPCFNGATGHPPIFPSGIKQEIEALGHTFSLRDLIRSHSDRLKNIHVHDQGILMDADTVTDFKKIQKRMERLNVPTKEECLSILDQELPGEENIRSHMANVCLTAVKLSHAVRENLNIDLIIASSLLHDIKRKEKNHADKGAALLREIGFASVGNIIAEHMDIKVDISPLKEKEVVFFADKICNGSRVDLNYPKRFARCMEKAPWSVNSICRRYESTRLIHSKIESSAQKPVEAILAA